MSKRSMGRLIKAFFSSKDERLFVIDSEIINGIIKKHFINHDVNGLRNSVVNYWKKWWMANITFSLKIVSNLIAVLD